jgi:hypothetical protein
MAGTVANPTTPCLSLLDCQGGEDFFWVRLRVVICLSFETRPASTGRLSISNFESYRPVHKRCGLLRRYARRNDERRPSLRAEGEAIQGPQATDRFHGIVSRRPIP